MSESDDRVGRGRAVRAKVMGSDVPPGGSGTTAEVSPFFAQWVYESVFGDFYDRPQLDLKTRVLVTMVALSVQGRTSQLKGYIGASLRHGWSRDEIVEALVQLAPYQGVPLTHDALAAAKEVFDRQTGA